MKADRMSKLGDSIATLAPFSSAITPALTALQDGDWVNPTKREYLGATPLCILPPTMATTLSDSTDR